MKKIHLKIWALAGILLPLGGCASLSSGFLLSPAGRIAAAERHEFLILGFILLFVFAPVALCTPLFAWYYRRTNRKALYRPEWSFSWLLEGLIWLPPTGIVVLLSYFVIIYTTRLDPYRPIAAAAPALEVQVVALDWKWLFIYPAQNIATVNQLVIQAGQPVHLSLTSGTVMQSFFIPRLAGQIYVMNGMRTQLYLQAARPGAYMGENTQYNGDGFPQDKFSVLALAPPDFARWMAAASTSAASLDAAAYQTLSRQSVVPEPVIFGRVQPDLFGAILGQKLTPGYAQQHHEAGHG